MNGISTIEADWIDKSCVKDFREFEGSIWVGSIWMDCRSISIPGLSDCCSGWNESICLWTILGSSESPVTNNLWICCSIVWLAGSIAIASSKFVWEDVTASGYLWIKLEGWLKDSDSSLNGRSNVEADWIDKSCVKDSGEFEGWIGVGSIWMDCRSISTPRLNDCCSGWNKLTFLWTTLESSVTDKRWICCSMVWLAGSIASSKFVSENVTASGYLWIKLEGWSKDSNSSLNGISMFEAE